LGIKSITKLRPHRVNLRLGHVLISLKLTLYKPIPVAHLVSRGWSKLLSPLLLHKVPLLFSLHAHGIIGPTIGLRLRRLHSLHLLLLGLLLL
jgi:hypothetical protein